MIKNVKGIIYATLSSATFGLIPLFSIPLLRAGLHDPTILFYRLGVSAVIMGVIGVATGRSFRIGWRDAGVFMLLGALYAGTAAGLLRSYDFIPSGISTTIHFIYPLVVTLIMVVMFGERSSWRLIIAALISLVGVALLSRGGGSASNVAVGVGLVLITVITYACYIVGVNASRVSRIDSVVLTFYVLLSGSVMLCVNALCTTGIEAIPDSNALMNIALLAIFPTVLSNFTLVLAVKNIGSTMTSILGSMEPMTAIVVGALYFDERFDALGVAGLLLVIISVIIVITQGSRQLSS